MCPNTMELVLWDLLFSVVCWALCGLQCNAPSHRQQVTIRQSSVTGSGMAWHGMLRCMLPHMRPPRAHQGSAKGHTRETPSTNPQTSPVTP